MADFIRQNIFIPHVLTLLSCLLLLLAHANNVYAWPVATDPHPAFAADFVTHSQYWKRVTPVVVTSSSGSNTSVIDSTTNQPILQGAATDGGGAGFSLPAIIWLAFVFVVGVPLALAGIRLWRVTTGMAAGLAVTVCLWAAFVNTVGADGLSDIVLTVIAVGGFVVGFAFGVLDIGRMVGILIIGLLGGFSIGVRIVLLRPGLLIPNYLVNWVILVPFMLIGLFSVLFRQRLGLVLCCAAIGTFLVGLGIDLVIEKQAGMSFGLRFLFDRNNSHFLDLVYKGYHPPMMTQIILGVSIGITPVLAFAQHKIFKGPFRPESSQVESDLASLMEREPGLGMAEVKPPPPPTSRTALAKSRFSTS